LRILRHGVDAEAAVVQGADVVVVVVVVGAVAVMGVG
jgi:hypothetical protein